MNKVFIICTNFYPVRDGGSIRGEKLVKYLPLFGWNSVVLTKKNNKTNRSFDIINSTRVYRTRQLDLASFLFSIKINLYKIFISKKNNNLKKPEDILPVNKRRISQYFLLPDSDIFWALLATFKGFFILKKEKPKAVFSSSPYHSVHIVGLLLKKIFKTYWIVEFRDPWTTNPFNIPKPFKILTYLDNYLEKTVLKNADIINVTSSEYKTQFINKYPFLINKKITNIPNGFDPDYFNIKINTENSVFTVVHTGNFYQHRSSVQFIKSVIYLFENSLIKEGNLLVKFIGVVDKEGIKIINSSKFKKSFLLLGFIDHHKCIKEIKSADLLLLIPGPGIGTVPGKFYEYLATEKPIFCISNEGPPKRYIEKYGLGLVSNDSKISVIANNLNKLIKSIQKNKFKYPDISDLKKKFNRKFIARDMARIFEKKNKYII